MRIARQVLAALALVAFCAVLTGCDTTRDKNQRAKIAADRSLATRKPVVVKKPFADVKVEQVQAVGRGKDALVVVRLTNAADQAWAALPINVSAGGKLLNRGPNIAYFANHVPAVGPGASVVWILRTGKRIPDGRLRAVVGAPDPELSAGKSIPDLSAEDVTVTDAGVLGTVKNKSGLPQYSVEVYLTTRSKGRYTAAALGRVVKLSGDGSRAFKLTPVGKLGKATPSVTLGPAVLKP